MIYENHFTTDWDSVTRDEAMVRAFVLGIAAAKDEEYEDELARLCEEDKRAFVEMAFNAGRREYLDLQERTTDDDTRCEDERPTVDTTDIVSELVISRPSTSDDRQSRDVSAPVDVPAMMEEFGFLDSRVSEQDRVGLPDFLER